MKTKRSLWCLISCICMQVFLPACAETNSEQAPVSDVNEQLNVLMEGRKVLESGRYEESIHDYFDKIIQHFESQYADTEKLVFCARGMVEMIIYSALGSSQNKDTEVLDSTWSDAYLMKGYALVEQGKISEARAAIESAIARSPQNAQYVSELAYTYEVEKNWEKALETYEEAADIAELASDEDSKKIDLGRAWRGQGYVLVELGKLDEAKKMYKKCLKLNRNDTKAAHELEYIKSLKSR